VSSMVDEDLIKQVAARVLRRVEVEEPASGRLSPPTLPQLSSAQPTIVQAQEDGPEVEGPQTPAVFFAPWTGEAFGPTVSSVTYPPQPRPPAAHPSLEQFSVAEAAEIKSAVSELVEFFEAQRCTIVVSVGASASDSADKKAAGRRSLLTACRPRLSAPGFSYASIPRLPKNCLSAG
jgi:hypothetical protein